jgi:hypothetical protein
MACEGLSCLAKINYYFKKNKTKTYLVLLIFTGNVTLDFKWFKITVVDVSNIKINYALDIEYLNYLFCLPLIIFDISA